MFANPGITADLAAQHRRELTAQARACRQARSTVRPGARPITRRVVAALAVASVAAAVLVTSSAGASHARLHDAFRYRGQHVSASQYQAQTRA